ncbi:MAG: hypothetical protein A2Y34_01175 [Spirochaetes bacterium GWC1_27_15]|nr:MAG: hypothetical protein A2Z98_00975 [Spirochaetes bacterium GWB1_27_13]OHD24061.1 MAG: hypothetical protein A2Y34_01175 [Spirochaetes bacterium GWC1_27_15]
MIIDEVKWFGQSSIRISDKNVNLEQRENIMFFDPINLGKIDESADIIFITHSHPDHLDSTMISKLLKPTTIIVSSEESQCKTILSSITNEKRFVKPGDKIIINNLTIDVVEAYNINKVYHPKESNFVGYIVTIGTKKVYFAGDTDRIPEMKNWAVDIAFVPVSGTYTMTADEAALAIVDMRAKYSIPIHYGMIPGTEENGNSFKQFVGQNSIVVIPPKS